MKSLVVWCVMLIGPEHVDRARAVDTCDTSPITGPAGTWQPPFLCKVWPVYGQK